MTDDNATTRFLEALIKQHGAVAGTVHVMGDGVLQLSASVNIPPKVVELTQTIPRGKGMAGLAWERGAPVQTCNLKDDSSGDVRPGAKAVNAKAAVAIPITGDDDAVLAVVGLAFMFERDLEEDEIAKMHADAADVPLS